MTLLYSVRGWERLTLIKNEYARMCLSHKAVQN